MTAILFQCTVKEARKVLLKCYTIYIWIESTLEVPGSLHMFYNVRACVAVHAIEYIALREPEISNKIWFKNGCLGAAPPYEE